MRRRRSDSKHMSKRIVAAPLWFLTGWMVGAMAAFALGLPSWLPGLCAVSVALLVVIDPAGWFWERGRYAPSDERSVTHGPGVSAAPSTRFNRSNAVNLAAGGVSKD